MKDFKDVKSNILIDLRELLSELQGLIMAKITKAPVRNRAGGQKYKLGRTTLTITIFSDHKNLLVEKAEAARVSISRFVEDLIMEKIKG